MPRINLRDIKFFPGGEGVNVSPGSSPRRGSTTPWLKPSEATKKKGLAAIARIRRKHDLDGEKEKRRRAYEEAARRARGELP